MCTATQDGLIPQMRRLTQDYPTDKMPSGINEGSTFIGIARLQPGTDKTHGLPMVYSQEWAVDFSAHQDHIHKKKYLPKLTS